MKARHYIPLILALLGGALLLFLASFITPTGENLGNTRKVLQISEIQERQNEYFQSNGVYMQMGRGSLQLPADTEVHVYDGPKGKGYIIIRETADKIFYTDYGPENRTKIIEKTATST